MFRKTDERTALGRRDGLFWTSPSSMPSLHGSGIITFVETTNPKTNHSVQVGIVLVSTLVLGSLVFLVRKSPTSGLWSFFFYKELPAWLRLSFVLSPALLTIAACYLAKRVSYSTTLFEQHRIQPFILICGVFAIAFSLFWLLREHRYWGDAISTIKILEGEHTVKPLGRFFWKEPLDRLLAVLFYDTFIDWEIGERRKA